MADRALSDAGVTQRACVLNKVNRNLMRSGLFPSFEDVFTRLRPPLIGVIQYD